MRCGINLENGFSILIKERWESVYWHICRMVIHHDEAQDATQETFIRVFRSFQKFEGDSSLTVWKVWRWQRAWR